MNAPQSDTTLQLAIESPARLHFGLLEVCAEQPRLFGGIGAMIDLPSTRISLHYSNNVNHETNVSSIANQSADRWFVDASEPWRSRMESVVKRWIISNNLQDLPSFRLQLDGPPPMHAGLGSGTQVACATATLLSHWLDSGFSISLEKLVGITQRGKRSFVGLAGHQQGGFIVDHGIESNTIQNTEQFGDNLKSNIELPVSLETQVARKSTDPTRKIERIEMPSQWHAVLAQPLSTTSISGIVENDYFGQSQFPNPHREIMWRLVLDEILPAIHDKNLTRFGAALFEYGRDAGRVFAKVQGGIYRDQVVTSLIEWIRSMGISATGQTSWGPTIYAILATQNEANDLCERLQRQFPSNVKTLVTAFNNSGYHIEGTMQ